MERLFDYDTLVMLFEELGFDLDAWITEFGYTSDWSDQEIYSHLPKDIIDMLGEFGINASWMHDGF